MANIKVVFQTAGPALEGSLELPDASFPIPGVLLCHPHPLYGGNMDNNVVVAVANALVKEGIAVLRFNFRGVGGSEGAFAEGIGELEDARAGLAFLREREEIDAERIGIAGYSFGGMIALTLGVGEDAARAVAGVSPVIPGNLLVGNTKPLLTICGSEDDKVPAGQIVKEVQKAKEPGEIEVIEGADHFWWGFEERVGELVARFFSATLKDK